MDPAKERRFRVVFVLAAMYDMGLGIVFTFFYRPAFDLLGIADEVPRGGYIPLLGAFVLVLGIAYALIARGDLVRNFDLIVVGTLYKLAYSTIALFFLLIDQAPHAIFVVFGAIDVVFLVLMVDCVVALRRTMDRATS